MLVIWLMQAVVIDEYNTVPRKNVGEGTVKYDTFFFLRTAKRSQKVVRHKLADVRCLISPFVFLYTYLLFLWFICQQTRFYGRYKIDISIWNIYIYVYFYGRYLHFIMRYLNIVTVICFYADEIFTGVTTVAQSFSTLQGMVAMFTR